MICTLKIQSIYVRTTFLEYLQISISSKTANSSLARRDAMGHLKSPNPKCCALDRVEFNNSIYNFFYYKGAFWLNISNCTSSRPPSQTPLGCLRAAYSWGDPKIVKRQPSHQCLFALLGSASAIAAHHGEIDHWLISFFCYQMSLRDLSVLDSEPRLGAEFCFNLYDGKKAVLLSAANQQEKMQWMEDIAEAAQVSVKAVMTFKGSMIDDVTC